MTLCSISFTGDLDFARKAEVEARLRKADFSDIALLDLSAVNYIDSSALSCFAALKKRMSANGGAAIIRIATSNTSQHRIFAICGLDKTFEMYDSVEAARLGREGSAAKRSAFSPANRA